MMPWQAKTILLVGPIPPPYGGMSLQTLALRKWLKKEGVHVVLLPTNPSLSPKFLNQVRGLRGVVRLIVLLYGLLRLCRQSDVIHLMANSGLSWFVTATPVLFFAKLYKVPVVVNYRGGNAAKFLKQHSKRIKPFLTSAYKIVVPSKFLESVFREHGYDTQIIPNCVDTNRFKPKEKDHQLFQCLIARNLEPLYGIDVAINAFAQAYQTYPHARLVIAGSGPQLPQLKQQVTELGLDRVIQFSGRLNRVKMAQAFSRAHLLINPSRVDNMPNALLEAQASGVPILSTDVGGIPHMVEHMKTAVLVPKDNVDEMTKMLMKLIEDRSLREHLIQQGMQSIKGNSWQVMIKKWQKMYDSAGGPIVRLHE